MTMLSSADSVRDRSPLKGLSRGRRQINTETACQLDTPLKIPPVTAGAAQPLRQRTRRPDGTAVATDEPPCIPVQGVYNGLCNWHSQGVPPRRPHSEQHSSVHYSLARTSLGTRQSIVRHLATGSKPRLARTLSFGCVSPYRRCRLPRLVEQRPSQFRGWHLQVLASRLYLDQPRARPSTEAQKQDTRAVERRELGQLLHNHDRASSQNWIFPVSCTARHDDARP